MSADIRDTRDVNRVIWIGVVMNVVMVVAKVATGTLFNSIALVADGIHSLSDLLTDAITIVGARFGTRPPDESHPYGHGKIETVCALGIGLALAIIGVRIGWVAGHEIYLRHHSFPGAPVAVVAGLAVLGKEALYQMTRRVAVRVHSSALYANAWHHRSDAMGALAVLCGFVGATFGWGHADQLAGIAVGFMIVAVGLKVGFDSFIELTEASLDPETSAILQSLLANNADVRSFHRLRSRRAGREVFLDVHILVDPQLTVVQGHAVADRVEREIESRLNIPANVLVHVEPDMLRFRKLKEP